MKIRKKIIIALLGIIFLALFLFGFQKADKKLTYIESTEMNTAADTTIIMDRPEMKLTQEFFMPVMLFHGIDIKTGTFGRNNFSTWNVVLSDENQTPVYRWKFHASQLTDGNYYMLTAKEPVKVQKDALYRLTISSEDCTGNSALAFYSSAEKHLADVSLSVNKQAQPGDLCFRIYGGEKDVFWKTFFTVFFLCSTAAVFLLYRKSKNGRSIEKLAFSILTFFLFLILMYLFTRENMGAFTDECDNIRGGMLIAKGKVLYRDYYAQHTPFMYYLCALYAFLGAGSIPQFRLLFYVTCGIIWACLYYRHSEHFGRGKMFALPVLQVIIVTSMFFQGSKIMGDNIQGLCMVALLLEFIRYLDDQRLDSSRSIIVGACLFISISSAFVSVFALAPLILCVLVREIMYWKNTGSFRLSDILFRYWKLFTATLAPFAVTIVYFAINHALKPMYLMAYQFNTTVYNQYQNQYGRVVWKPFFLGVRNFFTAISDSFLSLITASGTTLSVMQLIIAAAAGCTLVLWTVKNKRILPALAIFLCMSGNATRSAVDFHAAAFFSMAVTVVLLLGIDTAILLKNRTVLALCTLLCLYFLQPYITLMADHVVYSQEPIDGIDKAVIDATEPGEEIFVDAFVHDSIYLLYKERYPANRNCYILPWYMDWFEYDTISDLEEKLPNIVLYKPETEVYGQTDFCPDLDQTIRGLYQRTQEDSILWTLK